MSHDPELSQLAEQLDMPPSELAKLAGITLLAVSAWTKRWR